MRKVDLDLSHAQDDIDLGTENKKEFVDLNSDVNPLMRGFQDEENYLGSSESQNSFSERQKTPKMPVISVRLQGRNHKSDPTH